MATHRLHASQLDRPSDRGGLRLLLAAREPRPDHAAGHGLRAAARRHRHARRPRDRLPDPAAARASRCAGGRGSSVRPAASPSATSRSAGRTAAGSTGTRSPAVAGGTLIEDDVDLRAAARAAGRPRAPARRSSAAARDLPAPRPDHRRDLRARPRRTTQPLTVGVAGGTGFVGGAIAAGAAPPRPPRRRPLAPRRGGARAAARRDRAPRTSTSRPATGLPDALAGLDALVIALAFPNSPIEAPRRGRTFMAVDAAGTERLVAAARDAGRRAAAVRLRRRRGAGRPRHWFRAKWRAETAVRASGIPFTIIRPTWIYGPRDVSLNRFLGFARRLQAVPMTNLGRQLLAPVFIDDVAAPRGRQPRRPGSGRPGLRARRAGDAVDARDHRPRPRAPPASGARSCPGRRRSSSSLPSRSGCCRRRR